MRTEFRKASQLSKSVKHDLTESKCYKYWKSVGLTALDS